MTNIVLLSGLDGTGVLFEPFIRHTPKRVTADFLIYDLNAHDNQSLSFQCDCIEKQVTERFRDEPVVIIAESYSGLLGYELAKRQNLQISSLIFVACFLERPFQMARFASMMEPGMTVYVKDRLLAFQPFNRYKTNELMQLFRKAMQQTRQVHHRKRFKARCKNIATASLTSKPIIVEKPANATCQYVYLQAKQDNLIHKRHVQAFSKRFNNLRIHQLDGTHFLLQTNPIEAWACIEKYL